MMGEEKFTDRYVLIPYGRRTSAMAFTFSRYSAVNIWGDAFTLFRTAPLIPIEALARAYSCHKILSCSVTVNILFSFRQNIE